MAGSLCSPPHPLPILPASGNTSVAMIRVEGRLFEIEEAFLDLFADLPRWAGELRISWT
jgi:hypothetical protein